MEFKPTILIVDDDQIALSLLGKLVEKLQYQVVKASNGNEALQILRTQPVDLVISDYEMPITNGLELLKQSKQEFPRLPFILVTAFSNLTVIREAWQFGAFDFFQKPVFVDRLNQTVRLAIEYGHLSIARRKFPKFEEAHPEPDLLDLGVIRELAMAIKRDDLMQIVEEFETHARIELEQIFRFSYSHMPEVVKSQTHRLAGSATNLGIKKFSEMMQELERNPSAQISKPAELENVLERSIHWLKASLAQIFQNSAAS